MFVPIGKRYLVKVLQDDEIVKGVIITNQRKDHLRGQIIKAGTDPQIELKENDIIIFGSYAGHDIEIDGEKLVIVPQDQVMCVMRQEVKCLTKKL